MKKEEAITIIQSMIDSLTNNPNQFTFTVNITGTQVTSTGGGTGLNIVVTGGGVGSKTVGFQSTVNGNNIDIAQGQANAKIQNDLTQIISILKSIKDGLLNDKSKSDMENLYHSLKNTWLPGIATSVIGNILFLMLGISN